MEPVVNMDGPVSVHLNLRGCVLRVAELACNQKSSLQGTLLEATQFSLPLSKEGTSLPEVLLIRLMDGGDGL